MSKKSRKTKVVDKMKFEERAEETQHKHQKRKKEKEKKGNKKSDRGKTNYENDVCYL